MTSVAGDVQLDAAVFYPIDDARTWLVSRRVTTSGDPPAEARV